MRVKLPLLILAVLALVPAAASGQGGMNVRLLVNHGSAFREGSWVPIDVLIDNDGRDASGWVEVRTLSVMGDAQSPIYRVKAELPRGSRKRFRLHAYLKGAARLEARVFDGERMVLDAPVWMDLTPIKNDDFLTLVLDERVTDYGFLSAVVLGESSRRRFYRENLKGASLAFLADYPQCYESFDVIIMGDVDPGRIGEKRRELLENYVRGGGNLVVSLGANAPKYKGTWVEDLLGVRIGSQSIIKEGDLAREVFPSEYRRGALEDRELVFTELLADDGVKRLGEEATLATARSIGQGKAVAIAVDAAGRGLQSSEGYGALWRDVCSSRRANGLNLDAAAGTCLSRIPISAGVRIASRGSILLYLGLYFLFAIVINFLVFWRLKRLEWAWYTMVFLSIGFTAYAAIFGTVGRAKVSELEKVEILRLRQGESGAEVAAFTGILTARTRTYEADLAVPFGLAREPMAGSDISLDPYGYPAGPKSFGLSGGGDSPLTFIQEGPGRVEDYRVRASTFRLLLVTGQREIKGAISGELALTESGLKGELVNETDYEIESPNLFVNGHLYELKETDKAWSVDLSSFKLERPGKEGGMRDRYGNDRRTMNQNVLLELLRDRGVNTASVRGMYGDDAVLLDARQGPYFLGWVKGASEDALAAPSEVKRNISNTLLVVDLSIDDSRTKKDPWRYLPVLIQDYNYALSGDFPGCGRWSLNDSPWHREWKKMGCGLSEGYPEFQSYNQPAVYVALPEELEGSTAGELLVDLFYSLPDGDSLGLYREVKKDALTIEGKETLSVDGQEVRRVSYKYSGCCRNEFESGGILELKLKGSFDKKATRRVYQYDNTVGNYSVAVKIKSSEDGGRQGEWELWK